ncbi:hypothetical protein [Deinococcus arenicola]|uniref:Uncharacterized protein n=1 Tax=Deinococcus arenicola TaxID=2994950 RepID=A0ABU4DMK7_9DEIO|nr:hypothetical protein [Deinococcus sp. ZS9-10]MDV6373667.1 hypothetical protein [Deinococcus sp. ZS9-10]
MDPLRLHLRVLQLLDELHRIGFEQFRFARSYEGQRVRLQLYPASLSRSNEGIQWDIAQQFTLSHTELYLWGMSCAERGLEEKWAGLLAGELASKHLVGLWVLDFADFSRLAYGPDHAYREWFRTLRPLLQQGYLPMTWEEDHHGTTPNYDRHVVMQNASGRTELFPRPPDNPFTAET